MDTDILRLWQLVHELSDQLATNQKITTTLQAQAGTLKTQAVHSGSGFALRRYNMDLTKETFESELERLNAQTIIENQTLLHENKQLSLLLKEYEETMETIMTKFRNHALAAQKHELTLTRHYENLLQARETQSLSSDLLSSTEMVQVLQRLSHHLRGLLRSMAGETPDPTDFIYDGSFDPDIEADTFVELTELEQLLEALDEKGIPDTEWALEREVQISRLERENAELRRLLAIDDQSLVESGVHVDPVLDIPKRPEEFKRRVRTREESFEDELPVQMPVQMQQMHDITKQAYQQETGMGQQVYPQGGGAPLQRAPDLQPGMRLGAQAQGRRSGIIGRGGRRGGLGGGPMPGPGQGQWQPPPPVPWQNPPGGSSNMNLS